MLCCSEQCFSRPYVATSAVKRYQLCRCIINEVSQVARGYRLVVGQPPIRTTLSTAIESRRTIALFIPRRISDGTLGTVCQGHGSPVGGAGGGECERSVVVVVEDESLASREWRSAVKAVNQPYTLRRISLEHRRRRRRRRLVFGCSWSCRSAAVWCG